jgi:hypothetical protein
LRLVWFGCTQKGNEYVYYLIKWTRTELSCVIAGQNAIPSTIPNTRLPAYDIQIVPFSSSNALAEPLLGVLSRDIDPPDNVGKGIGGGRQPWEDGLPSPFPSGIPMVFVEDMSDRAAALFSAA